MIDEVTLLCAFIYPACKSGRCLTTYTEEETELKLKRLANYVENRTNLPIDHLEKVYDNMAAVGYKRDMIRQYIYGGHLDQIRKRIEKETGASYNIALRSPHIADTALRCAPQIYMVTRADMQNHIVSVEALTADVQKELVVLHGLEKPRSGDYVSGHWECMMETINRQSSFFENYLKILKGYNAEVFAALKANHDAGISRQL